MNWEEIRENIKARAKGFLLNIYEKDVIVGVAITLLFILGVSSLLFLFPLVSGERWLLAVDISIILGLIAYLELDTIHAKRELSEWIEKQRIPAKEKIFLKQAIFAATSLEEVAEVARTAILYQLSLPKTYPTPYSTPQAQGSQAELIIQLQKEVEALKEMLRKKESERPRCPHCGSDNTLTDSGFLFCLDCGRVTKLAAQK